MTFEFYGGDGFWGKCTGCGSDGYWQIIKDEKNLIRCECGHEEMVKIK